jgi:hypothetical protein
MRLARHAALRATTVLLALGSTFAIAPAATAFNARASLRALPLGSPPPPAVVSVTPDKGTSFGGTKVTIVGEDLKGVTTVYFGATAVTLKAPSKSATKIKTVSPAGTGTVNVTLSTPEATSEVVPADEFTYISSPPTIVSLSPKQGAAAKQKTVEITGTDLAGATAVHFGTISVPFTIKKSTEIKATSPYAQVLGPVEVTVTTPEGTSAATPADEYTFEPEFPDVATASPGRGPAAGGNSVTLHGEGFIGTSAVRFGGEPVESFEVINDAEIVAVPSPEATARVHITVTTPEGTSPSSCAAARCPAIATYQFGPPTVTSVSPGIGPLAGGTSITVTGSGFSTAKEGTIILVGNHDATSVECSSTLSCTAVTPEGGKAGTDPVEVRVPSGLKPSETHSLESPAAQFTYE